MKRAALVVATCAVLAACSAHGAEPTPTPTTPTTPVTSSAPATPAPAPPPGADQVRSEGEKVRSDEATIHVLTAPDVALEQERDDDGSVHLRLAPGSATDAPLAFVAGAGATALADGTALVGKGGLSPTGGWARASSKDVLAVYARSGETEVTLWFAGTAVDDTDWGVREGGRSLAVTPSAWARDGGLAASDLTWTQLVEREPDADSATMRDQLQCHELGAPDKATWNLEPWRPEVDGLAMIAARCNPT